MVPPAGQIKSENSLDETAVVSGGQVINYDVDDLDALFLALERESPSNQWDDPHGYRIFDAFVISSANIDENGERNLRIDTSPNDPAEGATDTDISPPDSTTSGGSSSSDISKRLSNPSVAPYKMALDVVRRNPQASFIDYSMSHPQLIDQIMGILNFRLLPYQYMEKILEVLNRKNDANTKAIQAAIRKVYGTPKLLWLDIWRSLCTEIVDGVAEVTCTGPLVTIGLNDGRFVECFNMDTDKWLQALEIWGVDMAAQRGAEFSLYVEDYTAPIPAMAASKRGRKPKALGPIDGPFEALSGSKRKAPVVADEPPRRNHRPAVTD